jgi:hypothetical protein
MGQMFAIGLKQPELSGSKIQAEAGGHWNASQLITQDAFFPALEDEIWALSWRLVPAARTRTV